MPAFLKDLRRLSSRGVPKDRAAADKASNSSHTPSDQQSGSSEERAAPGIDSPPGLLSENDRSLSNGTGQSPIPHRPPPQSHPSQSARYSIVGASSATLAASATSTTPPLRSAPSSPHAPQILSISENSWVHQKILLIYGQVGDPTVAPVDGNVWVCAHQDMFPTTSWPVSDSHFKALVHLQPGPNRLRLDFLSPKLPPPVGAAAHSLWFNINYLPLNAAPPVDLVVLLGKDSPGEYDVMSDRKTRKGNGLDEAIRKFRMAAYLWEAFTGEQMNRNAFGRRCFRFEEEWQAGTLSRKDAESGAMRNEAKIHVIRSRRTVAELCHSDLAQQNDDAKDPYGLLEITLEALTDHFGDPPGRTRFVSVLLLDSHWDSHASLIRGHAALQGGYGGLRFCLFGSHLLYSYPSCIEDVVPAFTDCTRANTDYVANDSNEAGSSWEAANIGIGGHLHETAHLFGCRHQMEGIMARDYTRLNRTFTCREPYSTRTKSPGRRLVLQNDECVWHRLDVLRFRFHPCFRLPTDPPHPSDDSIAVWPVDSGAVLITSTAGIAFIEIYADGEERCRAHFEYLDGVATAPLPRQIQITESDLRGRLAGKGNERAKRLQLRIFSAGGTCHEVPDFTTFASKYSRSKLPDGRTGFVGSKVGASSRDGSKPEALHFWYAADSKRQLRNIRVYHGNALDGVEFMYDDGRSQLLGKRGGSPDDFALDMRKAEAVLGFHLRAGLWIDAIQIITNQGRKSPVYGNAGAGQGFTLIPPRGYTLAGLSGSCADWLDGFALIITR